MGTPLERVYEAFLARITADEWMVEDDLRIVEKDWQQLLNIAISRFRFPRTSLSYSERTRCFDEELTMAEIQVLGVFMKYEWIKRCIASWENLRSMYSDTDFSKANLIDKLNKTADAVYIECRHAISDYDRSHNGKPSFSGFAGG